MLQRVISGVVLRESDPAQSPLRRTGGATFGSVMIAAIVLAIAGVIGVINPGGNTTWQSAGKVIVEEETGARFVWIQDENGDFHLHPVLNLASAALLIGTKEVVDVSRESLSKAPRGVRLGIPDAPDALPDKDHLLRGTWQLCSEQSVTKQGTRIPQTVLSIGSSGPAGAQLKEQGFLVRDISNKSLHLIWQGRQYPIMNEVPVIEALGMRSSPQVEVNSAWLTGLGSGAALSPLRPASSGTASTAVPGATVGEVWDVQGPSKTQYYLVYADHLQTITDLEAEITLADPTVAATVYQGKGASAKTVTAGQVAALSPGDLPKPNFATPPNVAPASATVNSTEDSICASYKNGSSDVSVRVSPFAEDADLSNATPDATQYGAVLANHINVTGGYGILVRSVLSPTDPGGTLWIVTDEGKRYAIANDEARKSLGYGGIDPISMPASVVARIPSGSALDSVSAQVPA